MTYFGRTVPSVLLMAWIEQMSPENQQFWPGTTRSLKEAGTEGTPWSPLTASMRSTTQTIKT